MIRHKKADVDWIALVHHGMNLTNDHRIYEAFDMFFTGDARKVTCKECITHIERARV